MRPDKRIRIVRAEKPVRRRFTLTLTLPVLSAAYRVTKRSKPRLEGCEHPDHAQPEPHRPRPGRTVVDAVHGAPLAASGHPPTSRRSPPPCGESARAVAGDHRVFAGVAVVSRGGRGLLRGSPPRVVDESTAGSDAAGCPPLRRGLRMGSGCRRGCCSGAQRRLRLRGPVTSGFRSAEPSRSPVHRDRMVARCDSAAQS